MSQKLKGNNIIVIGATGGIGRVLVRELFRWGATVWLVARGRDKIEALKTELGDGPALEFVADATDPVAMESLFQKVAKTSGMIHAVIITAGTHKPSGINDSLQAAREMADRLHQSIYLPTRIAAHAAQQHFRDGDVYAPWLINFSSHAATKTNLPHNLDYGPAKAAARSFMLYLAGELKDTNIRITDIQPATVNTPDNLKWILSRGLKPEDVIQPEEIAQWIIDNFDNPKVPLEKPFDNGRVL